METIFGQRLAAMRRERSLSQRDLADRVGVHHTYISHLETGREQPSRRMVEDLARALDADATSMMLQAGHMPMSFARVLREREELRRLLELSARDELSERGWEEIRDLLDREDRVNVAVWLD